jgi:hypothetical protein
VDIRAIILRGCDEPQSNRASRFHILHTRPEEVGLLNKKNKAPSLDLSFAYGTAVLKQLNEHDIQAYEAEEQVSSGDTTIRAITSLYIGKRDITGLSQPDETARDTHNDDD